MGLFRLNLVTKLTWPDLSVIEQVAQKEASSIAVQKNRKGKFPPGLSTQLDSVQLSGKKSKIKLPNERYLCEVKGEDSVTATASLIQRSCCDGSDGVASVDQGLNFSVVKYSVRRQTFHVRPSFGVFAHAQIVALCLALLAGQQVSYFLVVNLQIPVTTKSN